MICECGYKNSFNDGEKCVYCGDSIGNRIDIDSCMRRFKNMCVDIGIHLYQMEKNSTAFLADIEGKTGNILSEFAQINNLSIWNIYVYEGHIRVVYAREDSSPAYVNLNEEQKRKYGL